MNNSQALSRRSYSRGGKLTVGALRQNKVMVVGGAKCFCSWKLPKRVAGFLLRWRGENSDISVLFIGSQGDYFSREALNTLACKGPVLEVSKLM